MKKRLSSFDIGLRDRDYLVYRQLFVDMENAISNYAQGRLLDIGCGNKPYAPLIKEKCSEHVGCDIEQSHLNMVDIICPATDIPEDNQTYDTVFSTQVLEHVADHNKVFEEAKRLLKPGGHFIASVPMYWPHHEVPYDFFRFTKFGLQYLLEKNNFEVVEIKPNGNKWSVVGQSLILALYKDENRKGFWTSLKKIFRKLFFIKVFANIFFAWADKVSNDESDTLNFVFVGKKKL